MGHGPEHSARNGRCAGTFAPVVSTPARRALAGAALLDFAVSPLFIWDTFSARMASELDISSTATSIAFATGLAMFTTGVLIGGRLADALPPARLGMLTGGGVVGGLLVSALAQSLPVLVLGFGVLLGGASGLGYATAVRVAGTVTARKGTAMAIVVSAYAAGAVVLAPVADYLLTTFGRTGMFAWLATGLGILLACAYALLPRAEGAPGNQGGGNQRGGKPRPGQPLPGRQEPRRQPSGRAGALTVRAPVPALWAMFALGSAPALVAFAHAGQFAGRADLTVVAVSLLNAGNFAGRLIAGPVSDRVGRAAVLHTIAAAVTGACVVLAVADRPAVTLSALLVIGTQYGALSVLTPVVTAEAIPAERFGSVYGLVFSGWGLVGLAGPIGAAWLAGYTGTSGPTGVLACIAVVGWIAAARALAGARAAGGGET